MTGNNPLQRFFRQPKLYVSLPSKGIYYEPGALQGDWSNVPIFAMSGMDEIIMKTPDALFSGEATAKVIESCCPYVTNAKLMPTIDIDALLVAIRIATFGEKMTISQNCKHCDAENEYEIELTKLIDYFSSLKYVSQIQVMEGLTISVRPLQYEEMTYFSIENFKLQKTLYQTGELPEDQRQKQIDEIYKTLSELQLQLFLTSIENVQADGVIVTDKAFIEEYLRNTDRENYKIIKEKLEQNKETWNIPSQPVMCSSCGKENSITVQVDQSNFFA